MLLCSILDVVSVHISYLFLVISRKEFLRFLLQVIYFAVLPRVKYLYGIIKLNNIFSKLFVVCLERFNAMICDN